MKSRVETVTLEKIISGGQTLGTLENGQKIFVWGALPGEIAEVRIIKKKSRFMEGIAENIIKPASERVEPRDLESYLSTSPWQIMNFEAENKWKKQLVKDAFKLHEIELPESKLMTDGNMYGYRNKVEFSWWWDNEKNQLDLAFFRRGSKTKIPVEGTSLAREEINEAARRMRDILRNKNVEAYDLKTLLLRCNQNGEVSAQLYVKAETFSAFNEENYKKAGISGLEIMYSDPRSPASVQTKKLNSFGNTQLTDTLLGTSFTYATGGFFQVNLPVYEAALKHIKKWVPGLPLVDFYSGVGTIGLSIGGAYVTLVEQDEHCVAEMKQNAKKLGKDVQILQTSSENALEHIIHERAIIFDPPRAGLHQKIVERIKEAMPPRIIYLSCNPITQARDIANLSANYKIIHSESFNFFPRTPHIEHLVVLDPKAIPSQ